MHHAIHPYINAETNQPTIDTIRTAHHNPGIGQPQLREAEEPADERDGEEQGRGRLLRPLLLLLITTAAMVVCVVVVLVLKLCVWMNEHVNRGRLLRLFVCCCCCSTSINQPPTHSHTNNPQPTSSHPPSTCSAPKNSARRAMNPPPSPLLPPREYEK
jgi:hypothetical protein